MTHDFNWHPGIADPTAGGWITVLLYFLAAASCWKTMVFVRLVDKSDARIWWAIFLMFFLLGINKGLNLQTAVTELGRTVAYSEGWYDDRRTMQFWLVGALGAIATGVSTAVMFWARNFPIQIRLGLLGSMFVSAYVVIRAVSFHNFDAFITSHIFGLRWNWILEMTGIVAVLSASEWQRAQLSRKQTESKGAPSE